MTVNDRIKVLRKKLEINQLDFGKRIGLTESAVCNYENGRRNPSEQTIKSICREFNVNILWLKNGVGDDDDIFLPEPEGILDELSVQYNLNETEIKILHNYLQLSESDRATFIKLLQKLFEK